MNTFRSKSPPPGHPGPSYMSAKQVGVYLSELRSNPIPRPNGSRPPPSHFGSIRSQSRSPARPPSISRPQSEIIVGNLNQIVDLPSESALQPSNSISKSRPRSIASFHAGRPLARQPGADTPEPIEIDDLPTSDVDAITYHENGQRLMEKLEARSLRLALEDMDLKEEEKIHADAQDEASELVWRHQNPTPNPNPNAPYSYGTTQKRNYREHLRKGSHVRNQSWASSVRSGHPKVFDSSSATSVSMTSGTNSGQSSRVPSDSSLKIPESPPRPAPEEGKKRVSWSDETTPRGPAKAPELSLPNHGRLQKRTYSNGSLSKGASLLRKISGHMRDESKGNSVGNGQQENKPPKVEDSGKKLPIQIRRNPFMRARGLKSEDSRPLPQTTRSSPDPEKASTPVPITQSTHSLPQKSTTSPVPDKSSTPVPTARSSRPPTSVLPSESISRSITNAPPEPKPTSDPEELEKRSDDIRAATSKRLSDRSTNLPTPSFVSDNPNRPIVSFKYDWKPKTVELKPEVQQEKPSTVPRKKETATDARPSFHDQAQSLSGTTGRAARLNQSSNTDPGRRGSLPTAGTRPVERQSNNQGSVRGVAARFQGPPRANTLPEIGKTEAAPSSASRSTAPRIAVDDAVSGTPSNPRPLPRISVNSSTPSIPTISEDRTPPPLVSTRPIPTISVNETPSISISSPPIPSISVNDTPSISISNPPIPTIAINDTPNPTPTISTSSSPRALPNPSAHRSSQPRTTHITPAGPLRTTTALCTTCALPISGRVISAGGSRFHPPCFACFACGELLECVAFYPEPDAARKERIERYQRGDLEGKEDGGEALDLDPRDGDEGTRFYCHLDFHEKFSPRCKSCKTPIEGEVVVACGAEWHVGHFFCAECGDPFDAKTPFVEKDGYAWCVNCHTNRYSTKCRKCRRPVTDMVINALGAEWHNDCFCCMECNAPFPDGRFFVRSDGTEPICVGCEERRLKR